MSLGQFSKCNAIDGVEVSQEELEAVKEAANARADDDLDDALPEPDLLGGLSSGTKSKSKVGGGGGAMDSLTANMNTMGLEE